MGTKGFGRGRRHQGFRIAAFRHCPGGSSKGNPKFAGDGAGARDARRFAESCRDGSPSELCRACSAHNATPRSLVLLDEIGRGTSTFDGLSIAWSVAEYLHDSPEHSAKTLFATHYHELTELAEKLAGAKNYQITAAEQNGEVVFLHKLEQGKASKSYGIAVARLAGLPAKAIARAREVLEKLEKYELAVLAETTAPVSSDALEKAVTRASRSKTAAQTSLFAFANENVIDELREIEIEKLTDREAKEILADIKKRIF
jgi:DNA mismatch repair protein MutS